MKIDNNGLSSGNLTAREVGQKGPERPSSASTQELSSRSAGVRVDDVALSGSARLLSELRATVSAEPAIDQQRVDTIKAKIAEGTYHIDPERLASNFIDLESLLNQ